MDKETLQKKIESGDTVWLARSKKPEKLKLHKDYFIDRENKLCECNKNHTILLGVYKLDKIFSTKEDAEWQLEFGSIERTEKLELPTWEQFKKDKIFNFVGIDWTFYELHNRRRNKLQLDYSYDNDYYIPEKEWKLTYENYLEACRLCKKLFLGEEL